MSPPAGAGWWVAITVFLVLALPACRPQVPGPEELARMTQDYRAKGEHNVAVIKLKSVLQARPDDPEARFLLAQVYNDMRDGRAAEKELRRAKELGLIAGGRVEAELARALLISGDFKKVLAEIQASAGFENEPAANVVAFRGRAHLALKERAEALKLFDQALAMRPDLPAALVGKAWLQMIESGDAELGLKLMEAVLTKAPREYDGWMIKGDIYRRLGRPADAVQAYGQAVAILQRSPVARFNRGMAELASQQVEAAQKDATAILRVDKEHSLGHYLQAMIHFSQGKYRQAQESVLHAAKRAPDFPQLLLLNGAVSYALGSFAQAEQALTQFLKTYPDHLYARKLLAASLLELNNGKRALEVIQPALGAQLQDSTVLALAGDAQLRVGNLGAAADMMEKAAKLAPQDARLRTKIGQTRLAVGDIEGAVADLDAAIQLDPKHSQPDVLLAMTHLNAKRYDKALEAARSAEKKDSKNAGIQTLIGNIQLHRNDEPAARKSYERALALDPVHLPAAITLANLDVKDRNLTGARKRYDDMLAADPKNPAALMALSRFAAATGHGAESLRLLERAAKDNPKLAEAQIQLAAFHTHAGNPRGALSYAVEAVKLAPGSADALDVLAMAQMGNKQPDAALATYNKALLIAPKAPKLHYGVASAKAALNDYKGAEASLKTALSLQPAFLEALNSLGRISLRQKHHDEAYRIARRLQQEFPAPDHGWLLEADVLMAQQKYAQAAKLLEARFKAEPSGDLAISRYKAESLAGDRTGAIAGLMEWVKRAPADSLARAYLADALLQVGRPRDAVEHLEQVVKTSPLNLAALNNLAATYHELKDPRALGIAERAYKLNPDNPMIADTLGAILVDKGDTARALSLLNAAARAAPGVPEIRFHLAQALAKSGDKAAARKELESLLASGKKFRELEQAKALLAQL